MRVDGENGMASTALRCVMAVMWKTGDGSVNSANQTQLRQTTAPQGLMRCRQQAINNSMKFAITVDRDEDGMWVVECPSIPGCVSQGKTKPEALKNIREAIELCLEVRAERGLPLTVETRQVEVAL